MQFKSEYWNMSIIAEISGSLNGGTIAKVYDAIVELGEAPFGYAILDVSGVTEVTRAGARPIKVAAKLLSAKGGVLLVRGAGPEVRSALLGSGFDHLIEFTDESEAISGVSAGPAHEEPGKGEDDMRVAA